MGWNSKFYPHKSLIIINLQSGGGGGCTRPIIAMA